MKKCKKHVYKQQLKSVRNKCINNNEKVYETSVYTTMKSVRNKCINNNEKV
jgi:hypothetical protein